MNRIGLGLALGAGYFLGRTKKLKLALALGSLAAGKRLNLSPRMVTDLVSQQLRDNPQFKEIGEQLRGDLRGVGKAASGAMVERQMEALADRLHGRTAEMRDQLEGLGESEDGHDEEETAEEAEGKEEEAEGKEEVEEEEEAEGEEETEEASEGGGTGSGPSGKDTAQKTDRRAPARKAAPAKRTARKAPAKRAARNAPAKKAAAKETADRKKTSTGGSAARGARARLPKGGGES
ncbi:DNA primase [Streptomyces sp. NPDC086549]|uniref:DNA primase n=1 Tax=Streptomyces sp. NPDC086549 TaxID=3365752 RepID=UPI003813F625